MRPSKAPSRSSPPRAVRPNPISATTDGTAAYNAIHYRENIFLDLTKTAVNRLAFGLGHELDTVGATAVALTPGWLRSEMMLDLFDTD
ncbi:hypothetical protein [Brevibacterium oceani]|uniref:hypothetical protein n=1 Tax=Brevibacterium oceani TaxID=358099 RepID=UPI001B329ABC|nr:hypothetical protein [Brevibacterium oceani]